MKVIRQDPVAGSPLEHYSLVPVEQDEEEELRRLSENLQLGAHLYYNGRTLPDEGGMLFRAGAFKLLINPTDVDDVSALAAIHARCFDGGEACLKLVSVGVLGYPKALSVAV